MNDAFFLEIDGEAFVASCEFLDPIESANMDFMGVYVVFAEDEIIYVGKSVSIATRWRSHEKLSHFLDLGMTRVAVVPVSSRSELARVEALLIKCLRPPLNRVQPRLKRKALAEVAPKENNVVSIPVKDLAVLDFLQLSEIDRSRLLWWYKLTNQSLGSVLGEAVMQHLDGKDERLKEMLASAKNKGVEVDTALIKFLNRNNRQHSTKADDSDFWEDYFDDVYEA